MRRMWNFFKFGMWNYGIACGDVIFCPDLNGFGADGTGNPSSTLIISFSEATIIPNSELRIPN